MDVLRSERWLVTGATGLVGSVVSAVARDAGIEVVRASQSGRRGSIACDLRDLDATARLLDAASPDRIVHLAAVSKPAAAADDPERAWQVNVTATAAIAEWCERRGRPLMFASTDQVFSTGRGPFREADQTDPATVYGRSKLAAEGWVLASGGLVVRLGWVLNDLPSPCADFVQSAMDRLRRGEQVDAVDDEERTLAYASELSAALLRLADLDQRGVIHVAGRVHATPYQVVIARALLEELGHQAVRPVSRRDLKPKGRPGDVRLDTSLLQGLLTDSDCLQHA